MELKLGIEMLSIAHHGLEIVRSHLQPFLEQVMMSLYGNDYLIYMEHGSKNEGVNVNEMKDYNYGTMNKKYKDVLFYLNAFVKNWDKIQNLFQTNYPLSLCHSLKYFRNKWAHQSPFTMRELYRLIDECQAFLECFDINDLSELDGIRKAVLNELIKSEAEVIVNSNSNTNINNHHEHELKNSIEGNNNNNTYIYTCNNPNQYHHENNNYKGEHSTHNTNNSSNVLFNSFNNSNYNVYPYSDEVNMRCGEEVDREYLIQKNYEKIMSGRDLKNKKDNTYKVSVLETNNNSENTGNNETSHYFQNYK
jgi:hypothetical protein